jgi:hypothetical protein
VCLQAPGCDYWNHWHSFITDQLLKRRLINAEDLALFTIVDNVEDAVTEIRLFYQRYHSLRFVGRQLVIRLKTPLSGPQLEEIQGQFSDMLTEGSFEQRPSLPEEIDEPGLKDLARLTLSFNRRNAGRLRQLIDHLNRLPAVT